jgi:hypothetical protein
VSPSGREAEASRRTILCFRFAGAATEGKEARTKLFISLQTRSLFEHRGQFMICISRAFPLAPKISPSKYRLSSSSFTKHSLLFIIFSPPINLRMRFPKFNGFSYGLRPIMLMESSPIVSPAFSRKKIVAESIFRNLGSRNFPSDFDNLPRKLAKKGDGVAPGS